MGDKVTYSQAAKLIGKAPGHVYHFVKKGTLKTYGQASSGSLLVDIDEVRAFFASHFEKKRQPKGSKSAKTEHVPTTPLEISGPVRRGDVLTWDKGTRKSGATRGQTFAQVLGPGEAQSIDIMTDSGTTWQFSTESLEKRMQEKQIQLTHPIRLLEFLHQSFVWQGEVECAIAVQVCLEGCERHYQGGTAEGVGVDDVSLGGAEVWTPPAGGGYDDMPEVQPRYVDTTYTAGG